MALTTETLDIAAFMAIGVVNSNMYQKAISNHESEGGMLELIQSVTKHAPYAESLMVACANEYVEYPGVFDYEVSIPFGDWYAERVAKGVKGSIVPGNTECQRKLREMVHNFFVKLPTNGDKLWKFIMEVQIP